MSDRLPHSALLGALFLLVAPSAPSTATAQQTSVELRMSADRTRVAAGEQFRLQVRADVSGTQASDIELPDLSAFRVVGRRVSRPMQFSFGFGGQQQVVRSTISYDLTLVALEEGRAQIAPASIQAGGRTYRSNALTIEVGPGTGGAGNPSDPSQAQLAPNGQPAPPSGTLDGAEFDDQAFLRTTVSTSEPFMGEQVTVTVYLYVRGNIRSSPVIHREPNADGFWVHELLPASRTLDAQRQMVGGVMFNVYVLRRFAAFPLREGALEIGPMSVGFETGSLFDIFNNRGSGSIRREGVAVPVQVRALPAAGRPSTDVYVGDYTIEASLDRATAATGDAVTVTARVRGTGNLRDVRLSLGEHDGLRILEPEVTDDIISPNDLVGGTRTFAWLVVPETPGEHELGPLVFHSFSPETESYRRVASATLSLTAAGQAVAGLDDTAAEDDSAGEAGERARGPELGPVRTRSELLRNQRKSELPTWLLAAFAVPPAAWLLLVLLGATRRRLDQKSERDAPRRAMRSARKRLAEAGKDAGAAGPAAYHGEVQKILTEALEARLGEAVGGFTRGELEKHLIGRGMDEALSREVVQQLEASELARFSAASADGEEIARQTKRVGALLDRVDRFRPAPAEGP